MRKRNQTRFGK